MIGVSWRKDKGVINGRKRWQTENHYKEIHSHPAGDRPEELPATRCEGQELSQVQKGTGRFYAERDYPALE